MECTCKGLVFGEHLCRGLILRGPLCKGLVLRGYLCGVPPAKVRLTMIRLQSTLGHVLIKKPICLG